MKVAVVRSLEDIGKAEWNTLAESSQASWEWHAAWWRTFREYGDVARELFVITARDDAGALVALAPLMIETARGRRTLRFLGDGRAESADVLGSSASGRAQVLDAVFAHANEWEVAELNRMPEGSPTVALLSAIAARAGVFPAVRRVMPQAVFAVAPSETNDVPLASSADLKDFFVEHIHRWSGDEFQSHFLDRATRDFYRALTSDEGASLIKVAGAHAFALTAPGRAVWADWSSDVLAGADAERALVSALATHAERHGATEIFLTRGKALARVHAAVEWRQRVSVRLAKTSPRLAQRSAFARRASELVSELRESARAFTGAAGIVAERKQRAARAASHKDFYDAGYNTQFYLRETRLQKPEQTILTELRPALRTMRILDIGVGAGRTVPYFGTIGASYVGLDFAPNMVAACQAITGDLVDPSLITTADARHMDAVPDASCDFVLLSYNGIDDIGGEEDRFRVLREVRRVSAAGGYFCFSSHNMRSLTAGGATGTIERLRRWRRYRLLRAANPGLDVARHAPTGMIHDPGMDYRFPHYYIAPSAQAKQLTDFGFGEVRVFSLDSGREVTDPARWDSLVDSWVYYLCRT